MAWPGRHFTLDQMTIGHKSGKNNASIVNNLAHLVTGILDPLWDAWVDYCKDKGIDSPGIYVSTGYRSTSTTAHGLGHAADTSPYNATNKVNGNKNLTVLLVYRAFVLMWLYEQNTKNPNFFDQYISEVHKTGELESNPFPIEASVSYGNGCQTGWVHIGRRSTTGAARQMYMVAHRSDPDTPVSKLSYYHTYPNSSYIQKLKDTILSTNKNYSRKITSSGSGSGSSYCKGYERRKHYNKGSRSGSGKNAQTKSILSVASTGVEYQYSFVDDANNQAYQEYLKKKQEEQLNLSTANIYEENKSITTITYTFVDDTDNDAAYRKHLEDLENEK